MNFIWGAQLWEGGQVLQRRPTQIALDPPCRPRLVHRRGLHHLDGEWDHLERWDRGEQGERLEGRGAP